MGVRVRVSKRQRERVCVCVREREKSERVEREREREREERERGRKKFLVLLSPPSNEKVNSSSFRAAAVRVKKNVYPKLLETLDIKKANSGKKNSTDRNQR